MLVHSANIFTASICKPLPCFKAGMFGLTHYIPEIFPYNDEISYLPSNFLLPHVRLKLL